MAEYHVGVGMAGIYAGLLSKDGTSWKTKSDVTEEAIRAVAQYLLESGTALKFDYRDHGYILCVKNT